MPDLWAKSSSMAREQEVQVMPPMDSVTRQVRGVGGVPEDGGPAVLEPVSVATLLRGESPPSVSLSRLGSAEGATAIGIFSSWEAEEEWRRGDFGECDQVGFDESRHCSQLARCASRRRL